MLGWRDSKGRFHAREKGVDLVPERRGTSSLAGTKEGRQTKALADYEDKVLSNRDAWQFMNQLSVKVLSYDSGKQQVTVELTDPGRLQGTKWFIDASVLVQ